MFVRHLLDIKNTRFLYTKVVYELIHHHLVRGFDYKRYRKTDYFDLERLERQKAKNKRNFLDGFIESESNYCTEKMTQVGPAGLNRISNSQSHSALKEAYMAMRMINP